MAPVAVICGIVFVLLWSSSLAIGRFGLGFLWSQSWDPVREEFGAASSIYGTIVSSALAMLIAAPLSLFAAMMLVEVVPHWLSRIVGGAIELLAAIPSVIFGMWGLLVLVPIMQQYIQPLLIRWLGFLPLFVGPPVGIGMLTASVVLSLMILPYMTATLREAFVMVPGVMKESAYGLGATSWEVIRAVTLPYAFQGVVGAFLLGLGRALGETMAVTFVIGNDHRIRASLLAPSNSLTSTLANEFVEAFEPLYLSSLVYLALVLFAITLAVQVASYFWLRHMRIKMGGHWR